MSKKSLIILVIAVVAIVAVVALAKKPADNSLGGRMERASENISDGVRDAGREMDPDRGVGERIGEKVEDAGRAIERRAD